MDFVKTQIQEGVALMTLNNPDARNAIGGPGHYAAIERACAEVSSNRAVRAVVLTGSGTAFCAGGDVKKMWERISNHDAVAADERYRYKEGIHRVVAALYNLEVPVVAAINGPAMGVGLDLACMCDIRVAGRSAQFAASFVKLGIVPGDGGAWLLQKVIGPAFAAQMIFTGDTIDAQQALSYGLVAQVVDDGQLLDTALSLGYRIAANPTHALRMAKRLLRESQHARLESILEMSAAYQALAHFTPEHRALVERAANRTKTL